MMKLENLMLDVDAVDNGAWIESTIDENIKWKVRGSEYEPYQRALRKRIMQTQQRKRNAQVDINDIEKIANELIAEHLLVDWRGIETEEGPLPYSNEQAVAFMTDRKLRPAAKDIKSAIDEIDNGNATTREDVAGN